MKKIAILTSVLALTACGGGSGGGGGNSTGERHTITPTVAIRTSVTGTVATSNAEITSMNSEVVVGSNGSSRTVQSRASTPWTENGVTYTSYKLDDVKLFMAENLTEDPNNPTYLSLELNDETGRIDAIKIKAGNQESNRTVRSATDTRVFEGPVFEYVPDGSDEAQYRVVDAGQTADQLRELESSEHLSGGHWNRVDERFDVKTYGNGQAIANSKRLQYSDFGHFNPVYRDKNTLLDVYATNSVSDILAENLRIIRADGADALNRGPYAGGTKDYDKHRDNTEFEAALEKENYQMFAGGYALKSDGTRVDSLTPTNGMRFSGTAIGRVYSSIKSDGVDNRTSYLDKYAVNYNELAGENDPLHPNNAGHDIAKAFTTTNATLEIDADGKQILQMPFGTDGAGFYDVEVTKTGNTVTFAFDSDTRPTEDANYGQMYRRDADVEVVGLAPGGTNTVQAKTFTPGYYGIDNPTEAAGTVRYKEKTDFGGGVTREWEFQGAYGMTKDN